MKRHQYNYSFASIYVLTDLLGYVFYVGCTTMHLDKRLRKHLSQAKNISFHLSRLRNEKIRTLNFEVFIKEVDKIKRQNESGRDFMYRARALERNWVIKYHQLGYELTNMIDLATELKKSKAA